MGKGADVGREEEHNKKKRTPKRNARCWVAGVELLWASEAGCVFSIHPLASGEWEDGGECGGRVRVEGSHGFSEVRESLGKLMGACLVVRALPMVGCRVTLRTSGVPFIFSSVSSESVTRKPRSRLAGVWGDAQPHLVRNTVC